MALPYVVARTLSGCINQSVLERKWDSDIKDKMHHHGL